MRKKQRGEGSLDGRRMGGEGNNSGDITRTRWRKDDIVIGHQLSVSARRVANKEPRLASVVKEVKDGVGTSSDDDSLSILEFQLSLCSHRLLQQPAHPLVASKMPTFGNIPAPNPTYDAADFSDEAILASYRSQEDEIDFSEQDLPVIDQDSVLHPIYGGPQLGQWKGVFRKKKKEEKVDPSELLDNHLKVEVNRFYASRKIKIITSVARAESGKFHGDKAHFIIMKVERKGSGPLELESLNVDVMVEKVQPALSASAPALLPDSTRALSALSLDSGAQTEPLPKTTSPFVPDSLDPLQIIRFAPEKVVGLPSTIKYTDDLEIEGDLGFDAHGAKLGAKGTRKWGKEYEREERFSVWANVDDEATYESDRAAAAGKAKKEVSGMNVLHVCASANRLHDQGIPNLTIGLVVISYGQPFILTVVGEAKPLIGDSIFFSPFSRLSPVKFSHQSKAHYLHGETPITDDFGSKDMNRHWKRLVDWPLEFRNNLLGGA